MDDFERRFAVAVFRKCIADDAIVFRNLSKLRKTRKDMEKEMCEEPDVETARTGKDKVDSRK